MKTLTPTFIIIALLVAAFLGGYFIHHNEEPAVQQRITLEEILSIRELHLVKHTYHDLFFLHRKNDMNKPIRAIVEVPVTITAYLNLRDIRLMYEGDTLKKVILPSAILDEPAYQVSRMKILETRGFQVHAGKDLYPTVGNYLGDIIRARSDSARSLAIANRILVQAEAEGKAYVESILKTLGHGDVTVTFDSEAKDKAIAEYLVTLLREDFLSPVLPQKISEPIVLGFLPLPK